MIKTIVALVFFTILGIVKALSNSLPEEKKHIPLQIFWTCIFGILIAVFISIPLFCLEKHYRGSYVSVNYGFEDNKDFRYTLANDSTKPHGFINYKGDSVYNQILVYDKTGEVISGDSSYFSISIMKSGDYLLAECSHDNDEEDIAETTAMMFLDGVKIFEKTFHDPRLISRHIDFLSDKFIQTYTTYAKTYEIKNKEFFHFDGSKPTFIESLFIDEGNFTLLFLAILILSLIAGYFIAVRYVRGQLNKVKAWPLDSNPPHTPTI